MSTVRLRARTPSAVVVAVAKLARHRLKFYKAGKDGSGKCDIFNTGGANDRVYGVVFAIEAAEKSDLDIVEGLGADYSEKTVQVTTLEGLEMNVVTYVAIKIDMQSKPYHWYKNHVLRGAREHHLPEDYVFEIETVEAINDPIRERHDQEMRIYY